MAKPIYYLWIDKDTDMDDLEIKKQKFINAGFKIALIDNTSSNNNFDECLLNVIKNHLS